MKVIQEDLSNIVKSDINIIENANTIKIVYAVREIKIYPKDNYINYLVLFFNKIGQYFATIKQNLGIISYEIGNIEISSNDGIHFHFTHSVGDDYSHSNVIHIVRHS